jgi:hypothetical protein
MMTRARKSARESAATFQPRQSQFALRPFTARAQEHEAIVGEPHVGFSLADIDIFPKGTVQPKLTHEVQQGQMQEAGRVMQAKEDAAPNRTGMPDHLKSGLENLSSINLSGVRVHYNSEKPAHLNALAYTQGQVIEVGPGQDRHLPHEAWHAVQQMQGRVRPTMLLKGVAVNDNTRLEKEADLMGRKALQQYARVEKPIENKSRSMANSVAQRNNDKQAFQFVDNRQEAIDQRRLHEMANNSREAIQERSRGSQGVSVVQKYAKGLTPKTLQDTTTSTMQRMVDVHLETDDDNKKSLVANGEVEDFKDGTTAGTRGWVGVKKYRARYQIDSKDGKYQNKGRVREHQNKFTKPEAGHILGMQNGGNGGDPENIFAQDGGTNNGPYKVFENKMRADLNKYDDDDTVFFKCYLVGDSISQGTIANEELGYASSISSDEESSDVDMSD